MLISSIESNLRNPFSFETSWLISSDPATLKTKFQSTSYTWQRYALTTIDIVHSDAAADSIKATRHIAYWWAGHLPSCHSNRLSPALLCGRMLCAANQGVATLPRVGSEHTHRSSPVTLCLSLPFWGFILFVTLILCLGSYLLITASVCMRTYFPLFLCL